MTMCSTIRTCLDTSTLEDRIEESDACIYLEWVSVYLSDI